MDLLRLLVSWLAGLACHLTGWGRSRAFGRRRGRVLGSPAARVHGLGRPRLGECWGGCETGRDKALPALSETRQRARPAGRSARLRGGVWRSQTAVSGDTLHNRFRQRRKRSVAAGRMRAVRAGMGEGWLCKAGFSTAGVFAFCGVGGEGLRPCTVSGRLAIRGLSNRA